MKVAVSHRNTSDRRIIRTRLRMIHHYKQASRNVCQTFQFLGIAVQHNGGIRFP